ncbi:MAG: hypothetical protein ABIM89_11690 [Mycobacteriales bacterium]
MNNYSDVSATAVTGGLRHALPGMGHVHASTFTVVAPQSWLCTRNDAMRLAVRNASPAIAGFTAATAKQAPQSRGSSAHT